MKKIVDDYLKKLGSVDVDMLTDDQVEHFFSTEHKGSPLEWAYLTARSGIENAGFTKEQVIVSMRKSMKLGVMFECGFVLNETADSSRYMPKQTGWVIKP